MKLHLPAKKRFIKKIAIVVFFLTVLLSPNHKLFAGNGGWEGPPMFYLQGDLNGVLNPEYEITTSVGIMMYLNLVNINAFYAIENIAVLVHIINLQTMHTVWSYQTEISMVPPWGSMDIYTSENPIVFDEPGMYRAIAENIPSYDEDPSDNTVIYDFEVFPPSPPPILPLDVFPNQIDFKNPFDQMDSRTGIIDFSVPTQESPMFINVVGRESGGSASGSWLVQNMPVFPFPDNQNLSTFVDFGTIGVQDGQNLEVIDVDVQFTSDPVTQTWEPKNWFTLDVGDVTYDVVSNNGIETAPDPEFHSVLKEIDWGKPKPVTWHFRGCEVPNIDLVSTSHNPTSTPGYAGDKNACGPASCANSMQWLEDKNPNIPANDQNHREKMEDLSSLMGRADEDGVTTTQMVKGKLAYIDKHKLPIHVKYQSYFLTDDSVKSPNEAYKHYADNQTGAGGKPDFNWIKSEMEKGEDVEILFGWYDADANRHGGHWVALSGVSDVGTGKGFYFKDDLDQTNEGGNRQVYVNWVEGDNGWSRFVGLQGANNNCWVESAISESYDPSISFELIDPKIKKINYEGTFSDPYGLNAFFDFSYIPRGEGSFLNVFMKGNETSTDIWNVQNLLLPPFPSIQSIRAVFSLADLGFEEGDDISSIFVNWFISDEPVSDEAIIDKSWFEEMYLGVFNYVKKLNTEDNNIPQDVEFHSILDELETTTYINGLAVKYEYIGCEMPNIDLDSSKYNPTTVPGYAGDINACVPAATANSMQWLEKKHPQIKSGLSHREKLVELSKLMKRGDNEGTSTDDFIKGKLAYVDKYKLPIKVKFQSKFYGTDNISAEDTTYKHVAHNRNSAANKAPDFDFLMQEIKDGEDVEMIFGYYTRDSLKRDGGHCVSISGASDVGTARGFYFKDDGTQEGASGMSQTYAKWDTIGPFVALLDLCTDKYFALVESVVSESYDSTITFDIQNPKVERITFKGDSKLAALTENEVPKGMISIDLMPDDEIRFLNVQMQTDEEAELYWAVKNMILPAFDHIESFSYWFDYSGLGLDKNQAYDLDSVQVAIYVTETTTSDFDETEIPWSEMEVIEFEHRVYTSDVDNDVPKMVPVILKDDDDETHEGDKPETTSRGNNMPNIDLDSTTYNPETVDGYAGDINACGPAAASNSMQWLENTFDEISTSSTHREKLKELSEFMERDDNEGVFTEEFIEGKLKFIDKHKIPVKVKFQDMRSGTDDKEVGVYGHFARNDNTAANAYPTYEWLKKEVEDDEDVEIIYGYYDSTGTRDGGHVVTVSGVETNGDSKRVTIRDDLDQNNSGGTRQHTVTWKEKNGKPYFDEISGKTYTCIIETVVSESPDTTIKFVDPPEIIGVRVIDQFIDDTKNVIEDKLSVIINPVYEGLKYLNIFGGSEDQPSQAVKNLPLDGGSGQSQELFIDKSIFIQNSLKSAKIEESISLGIVVTDEPLSKDTIPAKWYNVTVEEGSYTFYSDAANDNVIHRDIAARNSVPSISINGEIIEKDAMMMDISNSPNTGGQAALANAMNDLNQNDSNIDITLSENELYELIQDLTPGESGSAKSPAQLIAGGLMTIDSLQQQLKIVFQSQADNGDIPSPDKRYEHAASDMHTSTGNSPDWDWIVKKANEGTVLISYGIYSGNGFRDAGQWALVVGVSADGANKTLLLSVDTDQANTGGLNKFIVSWIEDENDAYLHQLSSSTSTCWVESAIAVAHDGSITFETTGIEVIGLTNNLLVYRNPSSVFESVSIQFIAKSANQKVEISIYDLNGRVVKRIQPKLKSSGTNTVLWNGRTDNGALLPAGNYVVKLQMDGEESTVKILRK